ncbi:MAG: hypothetical protein M3405_11285 [Acidobacteriota bacterium]|jgi:hypothetical protein|nr:hypothetical protein [Acidobacteriota bacterium]
MKDLISKIKKWHIVLILSFLLFMPFPTEMVPKWEMQVVDSENQPMANVRTEQSWQSYTFFFTRGYDSRCTDSKGKIVYPKRYLWAGIISRIVSPIWANVMTLAHGSTGTDANIQVFDNHYISDNYYWREREKIYTRKRGKLPQIAIAEKRNSLRQSYDCK